MLKLSWLAAIAVISNLSIASAETPANVSPERTRQAPLLSADDVPLRPTNAAVMRAAHQPPVPDGKRPVVADAKQPKTPAGKGASAPTSARIARAPEGKQPKIPAGKGASIPASAATARARHDEPRIAVSAARLASLALPNRPQAGPAARGADASAAAVRNIKLANLPTAAADRSVAAHALVSLPTNAAPALRARSAAAQRKAMRNLPRSALVRQKAKAGRKSG